VEPGLSPCVHSKNTRAASKNIPIFVLKKILSKPLPLLACPPSLRLKETQAKLVSLK
jgi:hypothetical protein